jgi:hypothetical protein
MHPRALTKPLPHYVPKARQYGAHQANSNTVPKLPRPLFDRDRYSDRVLNVRFSPLSCPPLQVAGA